MSFAQHPDIALELTRTDGSVEVILFDPRYKLDSEDGGEPGDGTPKKGDVDKMHAYRDAIRRPDASRAVCYAAILYPGRTEEYGEDLGALRTYPTEESVLRQRIAQLVTQWLRKARSAA